MDLALQGVEVKEAEKQNVDLLVGGENPRCGQGAEPLETVETLAQKIWAREGVPRPLARRMAEERLNG